MNKKGLDLANIRFSFSFLFDVVGKIEDIHQLKVLLFAIWLAQQSGDEANPLTLQDFYTYPEFMKQLGNEMQITRTNLLSALKKNVEAGFIISTSFEDIEKGKPFYLNTERGNIAKQWQNAPADFVPRGSPPSDIFILYEDNIGPLTPLIADALKDAEKEYSEEWVEEAIRIAVANNVRKWRYIQAILNSWKEEGRNGRDKKYAEEDYKQYTKGKYSKYIKS